eukprot:7315343-Alexandrium_andersonii.AAC.1
MAPPGSFFVEPVKEFQWQSSSPILEHAELLEQRGPKYGIKIRPAKLPGGVFCAVLHADAESTGAGIT